jgi:hypothetical protein
MPAPSPDDWARYLENVKQQFELIDQLEPLHKAIVWNFGFDPVRVRQMLAAQRRAKRTSGSPQRR